MNTVFQYLKPFIRLIRREKLHRVAIILVVLILAGSTAFFYLEENMTPQDALWWTVVTMTTVGYGDISPTSLGGRLVGMVIMFLGIGLLGVFTATVAGAFLENKEMEEKGMKFTKVKNHFVICGWNFRGPDMVAELRADRKTRKTPIVLVADIPEKPVDDSLFYFIRGDVGQESLKKANMEEAQVAIILSSEESDIQSRDAKAVLNTLTIKSLYPDIYTCVELMKSENLGHLKRAKADEIVVVGELSTNLLVQASLDHGLSRLVSELVSTRYGSDLFKIEVPTRYLGMKFIDVMLALKQEQNVLCLGVGDASGHELTANPDSDYKFKPGDQIVLIAATRPEIA